MLNKCTLILILLLVGVTLANDNDTSREMPVDLSSSQQISKKRARDDIENNDPLLANPAAKRQTLIEISSEEELTNLPSGKGLANLSYDHLRNIFNYLNSNDLRILSQVNPQLRFLVACKLGEVRVIQGEVNSYFNNHIPFDLCIKRAGFERAERIYYDTKILGFLKKYLKKESVSILNFSDFHPICLNEFKGWPLKSLVIDLSMVDVSLYLNRIVTLFPGLVELRFSYVEGQNLSFSELRKLRNLTNLVVEEFCDDRERNYVSPNFSLLTGIPKLKYIELINVCSNEDIFGVKFAELETLVIRGGTICDPHEFQIGPGFYEEYIFELQKLAPKLHTVIITDLNDTDKIYEYNKEI